MFGIKFAPKSAADGTLEGGAESVIAFRAGYLDLYQMIVGSIANVGPG